MSVAIAPVPSPSPQTCSKVVVAAPKGGVGKTTVIMGLLVAARNAGLRAVGVNMDEQRSLTVWGEARHGTGTRIDVPDVPVLTRALDDYRTVLREVAEYDLAVFDTPPGHGQFKSAIRTLCEVADLVIIPSGATTVDLTEVVPFYAENPSKSVFVLNNVNRRTSKFREAQRTLNRAGRLCPVEIPRYESIHEFFDQGLTALDVSDSNGASELEAVWDFVRREIGR